MYVFPTLRKFSYTISSNTVGAFHPSLELVDTYFNSFVIFPEIPAYFFQSVNNQECSQLLFETFFENSFTVFVS